MQYVGNILQALFGRNLFSNVALDFRRVLNKLNEGGIEIFGCQIRKGLEQWRLCVVKLDGLDNCPHSDSCAADAGLSPTDLLVTHNFVRKRTHVVCLPTWHF
jgi:hypothetical protein